MKRTIIQSVVFGAVIGPFCWAIGMGTGHRDAWNLAWCIFAMAVTPPIVETFKWLRDG